MTRVVPRFEMICATSLWPLLEHAGPLPDRQPDPRPCLIAAANSSRTSPRTPARLLGPPLRQVLNWSRGLARMASGSAGLDGEQGSRRGLALSTVFDIGRGISAMNPAATDPRACWITVWSGPGCEVTRDDMDGATVT